MSVAYNTAGNFVPVRERREISGVLAALNSELVLNLSGDDSAMIYVNCGASTFNGTFEFTGTVDGTNFFAVPAIPYFNAGAAGAPSNAQPLLFEAINTTNVQRVYAIRCGQMRAIRIRISTYASGSANVTINSDTAKNAHPAMGDQRPTSLLITATGAAAAAVTASLPLVPGLRHYIDFIDVTMSATALLTAAATPLLVTTTNLPGNPVITFGAEALPQGADKVRRLDFGSTGFAATAVGTASTVVCPATTAIIWRVNVGYRLGL